MSEKSRTRNYYWISNSQLAIFSSGLNLKARQVLAKEIIKLQDLAGIGKQVPRAKEAKEVWEQYKVIQKEFKEWKQEGKALEIGLKCLKKMQAKVKK